MRDLALWRDERALRSHEIWLPPFGLQGFGKEAGMNRPRLALLAVSALFVSYYVWSFFVSSRYQALCNVTYWFATKAEIEACQARKAELEGRQ